MTPRMSSNRLAKFTLLNGNFSNNNQRFKIYHSACKRWIFYARERFDQRFMRSSTGLGDDILTGWCNVRWLGGE